MDDGRQLTGERPWYARFHKQAGISVIFDDWHPDVFKNFDAAAWVETIVSTGADSCHIQAKDISGNAYYITELEHLHMGLRGRDAFGELLEGLHRRNVKVYANISIIYDNLLFREHPDWRLRDADGHDSKHMEVNGSYRTGVVCFNSPYRELARAQLAAFGRKYDPETLLLDMIYAWIPVCYCQYCQEQYRADTGSALPAGEDRTSPAFRAYVKWRNQRLYAFTRELREAYRAVRPESAFQINTPRPHLVMQPSPLKLVTLLDYVGGDPSHSDPSPAAIGYSVNTFSNMKPGRPGVIASGRFHGGEGQHAGIRSVDEMTVTGLMCAAHNCAYQLFDICNADGTLYASPFRAYKEVFDRLRPIEPLLGGDKIRSVAIYVAEDTKNYLYESRSMAETHEYVSGLRETFRAFQDHHVPVDVITKLNLDILGQHELVCVPDALCMSGEEIAGIRQYVAHGGQLLATRFTSLADEDGRLQHNFALADVLGVDYLGQSENAETYVAVDPELCREAGLADDMEVKVDTQAVVWAHPGTTVRGHLVLPYTNRSNDSDRWVGCLGNPPGIQTDYPAIVLNRYGRGQSCYFTGRLNALDHLHSVEEPRTLLYQLARSLLSTETPLSIEAPPWVVVTGFHQPEMNRIVVHLVNCQTALPILPVQDIQVKLHLLPATSIASVSTAPVSQALRYSQEGHTVSFIIPELHLYQGAVVQFA